MIISKAEGFLKKYFGYDSFRYGQEDLIKNILDGSDVLGIMPTGAGKSLCFQIPALMFEGIVIVISPLISLMKDQVNALTQSGIPSAFINSSLTDRQISKALTNAVKGAYKLIYVAPERLHTFDFLHFASIANIAMVTVDEAHCISQWGQDFRPSYIEIPKFVEILKKRPIVSAFTATATPRVCDDIVQQLKLNKPSILVSGFNRPNLYFDIKTPKDKFLELKKFLQAKEGLSGIVYCATRANVEEVCDKLNTAGFNASRYHAGLSDVERHSNQDLFLFDKVQIMVATNAFGMGIDKSNVSFVVHYNMPKDLEGYYQEAGRAGRDGTEAECLLLYSKGDVSTNLWMIQNASEAVDYIKERNVTRLYEMEHYSTSKECLRTYILKYFGENPDANCGKCINCNSTFEEVDITIEAQKIISCVYRMKERYGTNLIVETLRGKSSKKLINFGLDRLSTFGISKSSAAFLGDIIDYLLIFGYLYKTSDSYPIIKIGTKAKEALQKDSKLFMKVRVKPEKAVTNNKLKTKSTVKTDNQISPQDNDLFTALKQLRHEIAKKQEVPAFVIFHDSTLMDMCAKKPTSIYEFLDVNGVGSVKAEKYGDEFISVIKEFV